MTKHTIFGVIFWFHHWTDSGTRQEDAVSLEMYVYVKDLHGENRGCQGAGMFWTYPVLGMRSPKDSSDFRTPKMTQTFVENPSFEPYFDEYCRQ